MMRDEHAFIQSVRRELGKGLEARYILGPWGSGDDEPETRSLKVRDLLAIQVSSRETSHFLGEKNGTVAKPFVFVLWCRMPVGLKG